MTWQDWFQTEPTGQKFTTGPHALLFLQRFPERCRVSDEEGGLPDVIILDRPYRMRKINEVDTYWLEPMKLIDLSPWPPTFGDAYGPNERDPNMFEVILDGGEAAATVVVMHGWYDNRRVSTEIPCAPELLAGCAADTLNSLRGRLVMEVGNEELLGPGEEASPRRRVRRRSAIGRPRPDAR
jgi:hypothetical protein